MGEARSGKGGCVMNNEEVEAIAGALALARTTNPSSKGHQIAISDVALLIRTQLKSINPGFDAERFLQISGKRCPICGSKNCARPNCGSRY